MSKRIHPKILLVEGREELRVIPELIEACGVPWGSTRDDAIVFIKDFDGISNLLKHGVIETELKATGVEKVGILLDANGDAAQRYKSVIARCRSQFPSLPPTLPAGGLIQTNSDNLSLGIWIMPDNCSRGMLETFLMFLVPNPGDTLAAYAEKVCIEAQRLGALFKDAHFTKAKIHTWLSWQDEPGRQLHEAVKHRVLKPNCDYSKPFVDWFRNLYQV